MAEKPMCEYCNGEATLLKKDNHIIGCNLEAIANILRYRRLDEEAHILDEVAARIK